MMYLVVYVVAQFCLSHALCYSLLLGDVCVKYNVVIPVPAHLVPSLPQI
jgi:hypothetical protein